MHNPSAPLEPRQVALAIGDEGSRAVMGACVKQARSVKDIANITMIPLTTVYRQIHRLESLGVLVVERSAMTADGRKYDLYRSRIREAHLDLDEEGAHVRWEPNLAVEERLELMWESLRSQTEPDDEAHAIGRTRRDDRPLTAA